MNFLGGLMGIDQILKKLLPFTVKDKDSNEVYFSLTNLEPSDWIITGIEVTMFMLFVVFLIKLRMSYSKDKINIKFLKSEVSLLSKQGFVYYPEFMEKIEKNGIVYRQWREFDESLIKKNSHIKKTIDSSYFFNDHTIASQVGSKLYAAIPGVLLGIGLFGTFLALYVALSQLHLSGNDTDVMKGSIIHFVEMVGIKFTASVWGVFLSVVFTFSEKLLESWLSTEIKQLQKQIDEIFPRQTAEKDLDMMLDEAKQQTSSLNSLAETLTQRISEQFNPMISQMNSHLEQMPNHISNAISETLKEPLNALQKNASSAAESQSESLEGIVQTFIEQLKQTSGDQVNGVQSLMSETTKQLTQLISTLQNLSDIQTKSQVNHQTEMNTLLASVMDQFQENIQKMNNGFIDASTKATSTYTEIAQEQHNRVVEERAIIAEHTDKVSTKMESLLSKVVAEGNEREVKMQKLMDHFMTQHASLFKHNREFIKQVEESTSSILNSITQKVTEIQTVIQKSGQEINQVPGMLQTFQKSTELLENFGHSANNASNGLSETVSQLKSIQETIISQIANLEHSTNNSSKVLASSEQIIIHSENAAKEISESYQSLIAENDDNLEKFSSAMSQWLASYHHEVEKTMQHSLGEVQGSLTNFANILSQSIVSLEDAIAKLEDRIQR